MNIETNSKCGGSQILTEANHSSFKDPHEQYVNKAIWREIPAITDLSNPYYRIARIVIEDRDAVLNYSFEIVNGDNSIATATRWAHIMAKINVAGAMTAATKKVELIELDSHNFDLSMIDASIFDNGANGYVVIIMFKQTATYQRWIYRETSIVPNRTRAIYSITHPTEWFASSMKSAMVKPKPNKLHYVTYQRTDTSTKGASAKIFDIRFTRNRKRSFLIEAMGQGVYARYLFNVVASALGSEGGLTVTRTMLDSVGLTMSSAVKTNEAGNGKVEIWIGQAGEKTDVIWYDITAMSGEDNAYEEQPIVTDSNDKSWSVWT